MDRLPSAIARLQAAVDAQAAAEEASRSKDEFLALLSHELRTPLQAMTTWLEIAEREEPETVPAQIRRVLAALRRTGVALGRLVEDVLDSSRVVVGKLALEKIAFDPVETVASTVNAMLAVAEERGIALEIGERAEGVVVIGDPRRLGQAIRALIDNALKFTGRGGRVVVDTRVDRRRVRDLDRPTTASASRPRCCRASSTASRRPTPRRAAGRAVSVSGSSWSSRSSSCTTGGSPRRAPGSGHGATFRLCLPIATGAEAQPMVEVAPIVVAEASRTGGLAGVRILLVEDDLSTAEAMEEILTEDGARVQTAASAAAARAIFRRGRVDLVLSDVGLPDEDGISLIHDLRQREEKSGRARTPAVAMSGYTSPGEVADMIAAGFDHHVAKPIADFEAFRAVLLALVAREETDA